MKNWGIGKRIAAGYGAVILITIVLGLFAFSRVGSMNENINVIATDPMSGIYKIGQVQAGASRVNAAVLKYLIADKAGKAQAADEIQVVRASVAKMLDDYEKTITSSKDRELLDEVKRTRLDFITEYKAVLGLSAALRNKEAFDRYNARVKPAFQRFMDAVAAEVAQNKDNGDQMCAVALDSGRAARRGTIAGMLFAAFFALVIAGGLLRSITRPLATALDLISAVADGDLTRKAEVTSADEFGQMLAATNTMIDSLNASALVAARMADGDLSVEARVLSEKDTLGRALIQMIGTMSALNDGMQRMSREHNAGDIDAVIAVDQFKGEFRAMAQGINEMVAAHIHAKKTAMACVSEFGKGNFDAPLEQFPGKKAFINDTIEELRRNLKAVTVVANYVDRISKGDIPAPITASYNGYFETIKNNLNTCIEAVNKLVVDSKMLSKAAVDGKLATRADASAHQGEFRTIVEGVNDTLDSVIDPVDEATRVLERIANKDLTARVESDYKGDHAKLKNVLNLAVENLDQSLEQVSVGAGQVVSAAGQINSGSQTLSQGASQQASALEEISSSLQEMASMTRQNSANAKEANSMAGEARAVTERGLESMQQLSEAMDRIKTSSDQTAKIIKTIDEIAFQTNLLALNAAVEAARAGDAGKGFAVVAEEVRSLAMRSAEAAKNTANMIEAAVRNAESGVKFNEEVNKNLREINVQATKVTEVMAEIAAASEQQSQGIAQVTTAVEQMDQVTQQNAANSEESASASEELTSQAEEMLNMVAGFKISRSTATTGRGASIRYSAAPAKSAGVGRAKNGKGNGASYAGTRTNGKKMIPLPDDDDIEVLQSF